MAASSSTALGTRWFIGMLLAGTASVPAFAQDQSAAAAQAGEVTPSDAALPAAESAAEAAGGEIIVTARRREETLTNAPVAVSAVGGAEIQRRQIVTIDRIADAIPQLRISDAGVSTQGGVVLIRGIGVGESNPFADQAVSFNVDGIQVSRANIRRLSEVDMAQIEVLKGPQALFFGKNSPAGIIVIRTADPTDKFEAGVNASYEFVGDEVRGDAFVSTPLADGLGARVAIYGSHMEGYFRNIATPSVDYGPNPQRLPRNKDYGGRLTLKYDQGGPFDARLKVNVGRVINSGPQSNIQTVACPRGFAQLAPTINDCKADKFSVIADPGPRIDAFAPELPRYSFLRQTQVLAGLEMNYALSDVLKLSSITGYYHARIRLGASLSVADTTNPNFIFANSQFFHVDEFSQEVRLSSSFDGPLNFMVGGYYQDADLFYSNFTVRNTPVIAILAPKQPVRQDGKAYSAFAQATWAITPTIELAGGGRYSYEKKGYALSDTAGNPVVTASNGSHWENFSPEATLAWRPNRDLTVYGAYKTGFLSGGFAVAAGNLALDRSYDQQTIKGFEAGVKARLLDGDLRGSFVAYSYLTKGLQVTANVLLPNGTPDQRIVNAKGARTKGFEFKMTYQATNALSLNGAVGYNHGRYKDLFAPCYNGQSIAAGCAFNPNAAGVFLAQNLKGQQMVRAPDWSVQAGANYVLELGGGDSMNFSTDVNYSSSFFANPSNNPISRQPKYAKLDAGVSYTNEALDLTVGLLGRNLTNKYTFDRAIDATFTGSGGGTNNVVPPDEIASVSRGREIVVRLSKRF